MAISIGFLESAFLTLFYTLLQTAFHHGMYRAVGPERSGSTWLFNAIRLLYEDASAPLDSFWITHLTASKLRNRGQGVP